MIPITLILNLLVFSGFPVKVSTPQVSAIKSPEEKMLTIHLKQTPLGEIIKTISQETGIAIIADAYVNDGVVEDFNINDVTASTALATLAKITGRQVCRINDIYVLRSTNFVIRVLQEQSILKKNTLQWSNEGIISVTRYEDEGIKLLTYLPFALLARLRDQYKILPKLPSLALTLKVSNASLIQTLRKFNSASGWQAGVEPDLAERRLIAEIPKVAPGRLLDALGYLFNSMARVTLERGEANRLLEADMFFPQLDRLKLSNALAAKALGLLSEEQKKKLQNGEDVTLDFKRMPKETRQMAEDYARTALRADGFALDFSRFGEFALMFSNRNQALGVDGYLADGTPIHY